MGLAKRLVASTSGTPYPTSVCSPHTYMQIGMPRFSRIRAAHLPDKGGNDLVFGVATVPQARREHQRLAYSDLQAPISHMIALRAFIRLFGTVKLTYIPTVRSIYPWQRMHARATHIRGVDVKLLYVAHDAGKGLLHLRMARHPDVALDDASCRRQLPSTSLRTPAPHVHSPCVHGKAWEDVAAHAERTCFAASEAVHEGCLAGAGGANQCCQNTRSEGARAIAKQLEHICTVTLSDACHRCRVIYHALHELLTMAFLPFVGAQIGGSDWL